MYGVHTNVLSFAKYDEKEILLVSINFNSGPIDMHYNLTALRVLFKRYERANIIAKLEDLLDPGHFREEYYTVGELLSSRIEAHIDAYKSILWKLTVNKDVSE